MRLTGYGAALVIAMHLLATDALAASAVALDSKRLIYEYSYGARTEDDAKERALQGCVRRSGRKCKLIISCAHGGYGAVYTGRLRDHPTVVIGATCGAGNPSEANAGAEQSCSHQMRSTRCFGPAATWHDPVN